MGRCLFTPPEGGSKDEEGGQRAEQGYSRKRKAPAEMGVPQSSQAMRQENQNTSKSFFPAGKEEGQETRDS